MAQFHCHIDAYRRSKGRSSVGGFAYRRGLKIKDEVTGRSFDFRKKEEVTFSKFIPANCDKREHDITSLKKLYQQVEESEKRVDATLGREIECSYPMENGESCLNQNQQIELADNFIKRIRQDDPSAENAFFDMSIHNKPNNLHLHLAMSEREMLPDLTLSKKKNTTWNQPYFVEKCRTYWEQETNLALEKGGLSVRVDRRTLAQQGIEKIPEVHEGKSRHIEGGERKMINKKIADKNALLTAPVQLEAEDLSQIYNTEEYGIIENADPKDAKNTTYQYRLAQQKYEGFNINGLTYCHMRNPKYVTLWFDDKSKIVDRGNEITAHSGTPLDNGRRVVNLAKLKGWKSIKLSGSDAFVEEAMRKAFAVGIDVTPTDDQLKLWEKIQGEATATTEQVIQNTSPANVVPTLAGLGEKLGRRSAPSAYTPKRGRGLGL